MDKSKEKKKYNSYNSIVIKRIKEKMGLSTQFIHQSLRGDRTSETSETVKLEYARILAEVEKTLSNN
ncbi:MAG: hypothetical protein K2P85_09460 [Flavobacteriaceae bacterium]|nr:hypothetical protein [Flavobacteriaceae bacterium]